MLGHTIFFLEQCSRAQNSVLRLQIPLFRDAFRPNTTTCRGPTCPLMGDPMPECQRLRFQESPRLAYGRLDFFWDASDFLPERSDDDLRYFYPSRVTPGSHHLPESTGSTSAIKLLWSSSRKSYAMGYTNNRLGLWEVKPRPPPSIPKAQPIYTDQSCRLTPDHDPIYHKILKNVAFSNFK